MTSNNILFTFLRDQIGKTSGASDIKKVTDAFNSSSGSVFKNFLKDIVNKVYPSNSPVKAGLLQAIDANSVATLKNAIETTVKNLSKTLPPAASTATTTALAKVNTITPKWSLVFEERYTKTSEKTEIDIKTDGVLVSEKGLVPVNPGIERTFKNFLITDKTRDVLSKKINSPNYPVKSRVIAFRDFFSNDLYKNFAVAERQKFKIAFEQDLLIRQKKFIEKIAESVAKGLKNTRLFKNTKHKHPELKQQVKFIQLFNFVRKPTEQEKAIGFDPHIMDFDGLYTKFKEIYDKEPEVELTPEMTNGLVPKRTRFTNAVVKSMSDVFVRLIIVDFCLKTLPVLDSFLYTKEFADIDILTKYLFHEIKLELNRADLEKIFDQSMKEESDAAKAQEYFKQIEQKQKQQQGIATSSTRKRRNPNEGNGPRATAKREAKEKALAAGRMSYLKTNINKEIKEEDKLLYEKVKSNLIDILNKLSDIFYVPKKEREVDQFRKIIINSIPTLNVHAPDERLIFNKVVVTEEKEYVEKENPKLNLITGIIDIYNNKEKTGYERAEEMRSFKEKNKDEFQQALSMGDLYEERITETATFEEIIKENEFCLQKYVKFGKLNPKFKENPKMRELENSVVNLDYAKSILSGLPGNNALYDCDKADDNAMFKEAPQFGLRLITIYNSKNSNKPPNNNFFIGNSPYKIENNSENYLFVKEKLISSTKINGNVSNSSTNIFYYNLLKLAAAETKVESNLSVQQLIKLMDEETYDNIFYPALKVKLLRSEDLQIILDYCFPVREIATMALFHSYLLNSTNEKSKFLLESVKKAIYDNFEVVANFGTKTRTAQKIMEIKERQREEIMNEGNPAGPLNFDLLKIFLRTPIHILRGLASIVDLNIFIADKIVAGVSIAGALIGQKIYLPYIAASISLLPFPIFTPPPAGIIPPLTSYTLPLPLGPIFLLLEPLLWDLPWFQDVLAGEQNATTAKTKRDLGVDVPLLPGETSDEDEDEDEQGIDKEDEDSNFLDIEIAPSIIDAIIEKFIGECEKE